MAWFPGQLWISGLSWSSVKRVRCGGNHSGGSEYVVMSPPGRETGITFASSSVAVAMASFDRRRSLATLRWLICTTVEPLQMARAISRQSSLYAVFERNGASLSIVTMSCSYVNVYLPLWPALAGALANIQVIYLVKVSRM